MFNTDFVFSDGKLTAVLDGGAGSSGKGKLGSFLCEHSQKWKFARHTFTPQAGHWVKLDDTPDGFFYQALNSCAYLVNRYEKLYVAPGAAIELSRFEEEVKRHKIPAAKIGVSPLTSVLQDIDKGYERGTLDLEGNELLEPIPGGPLIGSGSTRHGCGANRARRVLRHKKALFAKDCPQLKPYLCDVSNEIMDRLDRGESGLLEIAQGFQLSYLLPAMFPHTTSRNCTVAAAIDDLMVSPYYLGKVILNFRTFPIRIHNHVYQDIKTKKSLNWDEVIARWKPEGQAEPTPEVLKPFGIEMIEGDSGPPYHDQTELSRAQLNELIGSPNLVDEMTSVTKLPRRYFTFSRQNVKDSIRHNNTGSDVYLSLNFANYVDPNLESIRGVGMDAIPGESRLRGWIDKNLGDYRQQLRFIGTGAKTDDMVLL